MIPLRINRKQKIFIPAFWELTVKQYIDLRKARQIKEKEGKEFTVIDYISSVKNLPYDHVYFAKIENPAFIARLIGEEVDYTKIRKPDEIRVGRDVYNIRKVKINTVGQRVMIELNGKDMEIEQLLCLILAIAIVKENDWSKVETLMNAFMDKRYIEVLPAGFFFLKRLKPGKIGVRTFLSSLMMLMNTRKRRNRLGSNA